MEGASEETLEVGSEEVMPGVDGRSEREVVGRGRHAAASDATFFARSERSGLSFWLRLSARALPGHAAARLAGEIPLGEEMVREVRRRSYFKCGTSRRMRWVAVWGCPQCTYS